MKYDHVFFDLDRTLWDFDKNSKETLLDLYGFYDLEKKGVWCPEEFIRHCFHENHQGWILYRNGSISKEELRIRRFTNALKNMGISFTSEQTEELNAYYMQHCPLKTNLLPFAKELLIHLSGKYAIHIITNGFRETQLKKITNSGLLDYFDIIITSDMAGMSKPSSGIFKYSLKQIKAKPTQAIMIGDDLEADIVGARNFGIDQIYYNRFSEKHSEKILHEVITLMEITTIL